MKHISYDFILTSNDPEINPFKYQSPSHFQNLSKRKKSYQTSVLFVENAISCLYTNTFKTLGVNPTF